MRKWIATCKVQAKSLRLSATPRNRLEPPTFPRRSIISVFIPQPSRCNLVLIVAIRLTCQDPRPASLLMNSYVPVENSGRPVSLVIPAYNEERNVAAVFEAIKLALPGPEVCEIIFVDDGSMDATAERVRNLRAQDSLVRLIRFGRNFGQQSALLAGLEAARGAAVITLDCDLQHPPELLPQMVQAWRNGAKVVQMVRTQTAGVGFLKTLTSRVFYKFVNMMSETQVVSGAADYQLLDRVVIDAVLQFKDRYPFIRGLVGWLGFPATRIEYVAPERHIGTTGYTLRKMLRLSLQAVMGLSSKPLRFSFYFGLLTAAFCVLYAIYALLVLAAGKVVQGWTSVIVMVTFLGAIQLVSIGIVGEYLARVFDQSRGTPRYVIVEADEAHGPEVVCTKPPLEKN
jgi:polyisoprenyl-phosphate glycosyltransferase